jgi:hypothetical protein
MRLKPVSVRDLRSQVAKPTCEARSVKSWPKRQRPGVSRAVANSSIASRRDYSPTAALCSVFSTMRADLPRKLRR